MISSILIFNFYSYLRILLFFYMTTSMLILKIENSTNSIYKAFCNRLKKFRLGDIAKWLNVFNIIIIIISVLIFWSYANMIYIMIFMNFFSDLWRFFLLKTYSFTVTIQIWMKKNDYFWCCKKTELKLSSFKYLFYKLFAFSC
jgi:hypothetical protein